MEERERATRCEKMLADYREQPGRPFEHESRLKELLVRQAELNAVLDLDKGERQVAAPADGNAEVGDPDETVPTRGRPPALSRSGRRRPGGAGNTVGLPLTPLNATSPLRQWCGGSPCRRLGRAGDIKAYQPWGSVTGPTLIGRGVLGRTSAAWETRGGLSICGNSTTGRKAGCFWRRAAGSRLC